MRKYGFLILIALQTVIVVTTQSFVLADTYQWTDADGTVHFSDTPISVPKGKKPIVRREESGSTPSLLKHNSSPTFEQSTTQSEVVPSWVPSSSCFIEQGNAINICNPPSTIETRFRKKVSRRCLEIVDSGKEPDDTCKRELERSYNSMEPNTEYCVQNKLSAQCKDEMNALSQHTQQMAATCAHIAEMMTRMCGVGLAANERCYKERGPEFEAACSRKK